MPETIYSPVTQPAPSLNTAVVKVVTVKLSVYSRFATVLWSLSCDLRFSESTFIIIKAVVVVVAIGVNFNE